MAFIGILFFMTKSIQNTAVIKFTTGIKLIIFCIFIDILIFSFASNTLYGLFKTLSNYSKNFLNCQADLHIRIVNLLIRRSEVYRSVIVSALDSRGRLSLQSRRRTPNYKARNKRQAFSSGKIVSQATVEFALQTSSGSTDEVSLTRRN